ncbi:MAG: hypothetical protein SFW09_00625 [Hyphomicrobiaceae bacterium]|nr:hypothetical protein [Hyphomicrobiaceae bacterium]
MLDRIEELANLSVARGCGFAALAILTFFIGMSADLTIALKSAGVLSLLVCAVLLLKAGAVHRQPYRNTEVWIMLKPAERPEAAVAQEIISSVLKDAYLRFAKQAALLATLFMIGAIISALLLP